MSEGRADPIQPRFEIRRMSLDVVNRMWLDSLPVVYAALRGVNVQCQDYDFQTFPGYQDYAVTCHHLLPKSSTKTEGRGR